MTFAQLLLYTEDMQAQQRVENGVKEIILGYYGHEPDDNVSELDKTVAEVVGEFDGGPIIQTSMDELPDDVRSIFLAEQHRMKTGELRNADEFRVIKEVGKEEDT